MDTVLVSDVMREAVGVAIKLSSPMLLLSMLVGMVVAVLQAVTPVSYTHLVVIDDNFGVRITEIVQKYDGDENSRK